MMFSLVMQCSIMEHYGDRQVLNAVNWIGYGGWYYYTMGLCDEIQLIGRV